MSTKANKGKFYRSKGLKDAEALAKRSPGTIERSSEQDLQGLKAGNAVQLICEIETNDRKAPKSEKLWVTITAKNKSGFKGKLQKIPKFIQNLPVGEIIEFEERHVLITMPCAAAVSAIQPFFEGCLTTIDILQGRKRIGYMFREEPKDEEDSGWIILSGDESEEYFDNEKNIMMMALGHVIIIDRSIERLLDAPVGTEYYRSKNGKRFVESKFAA